MTALGSVSLATLLAACTRDEVATSSSTFDGAATCTLALEQTEGPFYFDVDQVRSDIREDREGTTLRLAMRVQEAAACTPIADSIVEIWHCDAAGLYSGFESASQGAGGGVSPSDTETYLRGAQVTNAEGLVEFTTIYPGWYPGRTPHVHFKVHVDNASSLTSQLYFDDALSDAVYEDPPYEPGRDASNDDDGIFDPSLVMTLSADGDGYRGLMTVGVTA